MGKKVLHSLQPRNSCRLGLSKVMLCYDGVKEMVEEDDVGQSYESGRKILSLYFHYC